MRILVFDTETTGLPQSKFISPSTLHQWPHIVQFSYVIYDTSLNDIIQSKDYIIKHSESILIPEESSKIHGITNEISQKNGVLINDVLTEFFYFLRGVDILIGHNVEFDINMIKVELLRIINKNDLLQEQRLSQEQIKFYKYELHFLTNFKNISCTLKDSIKFCNIQSIDKNGKPYLKYPKLIELHEKLFNKTPINLHNSFNDILVTLRCFMKLKHNIDLIDNCNSFKKYSNLIGII
jgi:DNA polymerase III epsilon subunit-like protein